MLSEAMRSEMAQELRVESDNPDFVRAIDTLEKEETFDGVSKKTVRKWKDAICELRDEMYSYRQVRIRETAKALMRAAVLTEVEILRGRAMDRERANCAALEPAVRHFRERVLENRLLERAEAMAFIESPALALLSQRQCTEEGIPLVGHHATFTEQNAEPMPPTWDAKLTVTPPGRTLHVQPQVPERPVRLWYPRDEWAHAVRVWKSSVLGELWNICEDLTQQYGWKNGNASLFVLTGLRPLTYPVTMQWQNDPKQGDTITLEIASWVSAKTVERIYKAAQDEIYKTVPGVLSKRNLAIFDFVTKNQDIGGENLSWDTLTDMWNHEHVGARSYRSHRRKYFKFDYDRVRVALLHPGYRNDDPSRTAWELLADDNAATASDNHADNQEE